MAREKIYEDFSFLHHRAKIALFLILIIFFLLALNYWKIQILDHRKYWVLSEANRLKEIIIPAPRGRMFDRQGLILADNTVAFRVCLIRENNLRWKDSLPMIAKLLKMDLTSLQERINKFTSQPFFFPIVIKDNLSLEEIARIEARQLEFPELFIDREPKRFYPFGQITAHVTGYIQEISYEELNSGEFKNKTMGDLVGKTGLERRYENWLEGVNGKKLEIVDSLGRSHGEYSRIEPKTGHDLQLSLDLDLQRKAAELLEGREGAIVALEPKSGEVLVLYSSPSFDPNRFVSRLSFKEWMEINNRGDNPLENRAVRGLYPPGSIFKLSVALSALHKGLITSQTMHFCSGEANYYGRTFACWQRGGHGWINLVEAIKNSCNIYFYNIGRQLGIENIAQTARQIGFGSLTGIDLPGEKEGLVPDPRWKQRILGQEWFPGETISVSIGQGPIQVTPLQIAVYTALIANRGRPVKPHLVKNKDMMSKDQNNSRTSINLKPDYFETIIEGMWLSVNQGGTGHLAMVDGFDVCGKTGSAQIISREKAEKKQQIIRPHSWFTGFAPRYDPKIVVTVIVEYGGLGGASAAPLAKEIFAFYQNKINKNKNLND
ncbi:MAG: penicillin-binding protein 2 [Candidatus Aminicenantes bacterium]|nr:penicillin-binding protein 2 [Candidatus Aminicenantes bacterium]